MADLIDFVTNATSGPSEKLLVEEFLQELKKGDAKGLLEWLNGKDYKDVSLGECERLIANKEAVISASEKGLRNAY